MPTPEPTRSDLAEGDVPPAGDAYARLHASPEFATLRRRFRRFVFPVTVLFLAWYLLYVIAANYLHDLMAYRIGGSNINVALIFGLLQFVSTFLIAWLYARKAGRDFDPLASELRAGYEHDAATGREGATR